MGTYDNQKLMKGIKLYTAKEYEGLSQEQKERHCETVIQMIIMNSEELREGITTPALLNLIPYFKTDKSIKRYLEKFVNTNLAYKKRIGRTDVYFHNGRILHEALIENIALGKKLYSFYRIKNSEGDYIFIQEKKKNELNAVTISGGIIIERAYFDEFLEHLQDMARKINKHEGVDE